MSVGSLQDLILLFFDKLHEFAIKNEDLYNPSIKNVLPTINGIPLIPSGLQVKKYFYKEHSNVTREDFLTTAFGLWIDTCFGTDNTLHGNGRAVEKSDNLLQIEKRVENGDGDLTCHVFSIDNPAAHLAVSEGSRIVTIEK